MLTLIRPHVKYVPQVWDHYLLKDIVLLKRIQKFALSICYKDWLADYLDLLDLAHIPTLVVRCKKAKFIHFYEIVFGLLILHWLPLSVEL